MDNKDTCSLKDSKKMDANTVWQWRVMHVKKYSTNPEPFLYSSKIGLDFNVGSNIQKKLDLQLVTNGVILELCDFAETVNKSRGHFMANILENNFDLGLENEQQRIDFTAQILQKVKDLMRKPPEDKHEVFPLFDKSECNSSNGLNLAEHKTESFLVDMDTDDSEPKDEFKCSQATSKQFKNTESVSEEMDGADAGDSEYKDEFKCTGAQSAEELKEDVLPPSFPHCEEINLNLDVGSKQSLDPGLLTKGVMLELELFTRVLAASSSPIVLGVLEHNFELDLKRQPVKNQVWSKIAHLLKRIKQLGASDRIITLEFKKEQFSFQTNPLKRPRESMLSNTGTLQYQFEEETENRQELLAPLTTSEQVTKRCRIAKSEHMDTDTSSNRIDFCDSGAAEGDDGYTCPSGESDPDLGKIKDSENTCSLDPLPNPTSSDMDQEKIGTENIYTCPVGESDLDSDEDTYLENTGNRELFQNPPSSDMDQEKMGTENNYTLPLEKSDLDSDEDTYLENTGNQELFQNSPSSDMDQERMGTENNLWKLRANRVKQIISPSMTKLNPLKGSKKFGIEFNVGYGPKQNISVDSLSHHALLKVAKFALAMNSSQQDFIMEILEFNFDLGLQNEHQRNVFTFEIMNRVRQLRKCEDAVKFSKEVFELPVPMPSMDMANQSAGSPELSSTSRMEECCVDPLCPPDSQAETKEHISQNSVELHPFCKEIGLRLHVNNSQPNKKLDIHKLTNGAMTEVSNFAEELCGTFDQICLDIIRHNIDPDLQSGDTDLARSIVEQIPSLMEQNNLLTFITRKLKHSKDEFSRILKPKLDCQSNPDFNACSTGSSQTDIIDQNVSSSIDSECQNELNLKLWKARASRIRRILSMHEEHCPLYSYSRCTKLGIDFNVGSGVKKNLDPKLLTNGIMFELDTLATLLSSSKKHFITEILEYNFNLNLKNELIRSAFTEQVMSKASIHTKGHKMKEVFELPDMQLIEESACTRTAYCPKCYQDRNIDLHQDEPDSGYMHHSHPHSRSDRVDADRKCTAQKLAKDLSSALSMTEESIRNRYSRCVEVGLNLCMDEDRPMEKLDTHVLTRGMMKEVGFFAKRLCGRKNKVINDILEHNFNIGMQWRDVAHSSVLYSAKAIKSGGLNWLDDVYVVPQRSHKQPGHVIKVESTSAVARRERKERATLPSDIVQSKTNLQSKGNCFPICTEIGLDLDVISKSGKKEKLDLKLLTRAVVMEIHTFATQEAGLYFPRTLFDILDYNFDLRSQHYRRWEFSIAIASAVNTMVKNYCEQLDRADEVFELPFSFDPRVSKSLGEKTENKRSAHSSLDIASKSSGLDIPAPFLTTTEVSSNLQTVNPNINLPFASQPDKTGLCESEEQIWMPRNASNKCDMQQEEMGTEGNLWKLRANRVEQIISSLNKEFGSFTWSKRVGLEFNVGFGPKQNISVDSLNYRALLEVAKFALSMNSSQQDFIMEILEYNFDLGLQNEHQRNVFTDEIMTRVQQLRSCEDAVKFSKEVFELPVPMSSMNMANQSVGSPELSSTSRMEECCVDHLCPPDSQAETKEHISQNSVDLHPFCKEIGLRLHVNNSQPNKKLDIHKLTNGAMTEVSNFAEELCGTFDQICLDIIRHNFDLDLQSGDTDLARSIVEQIPAAVAQNNLSKCVKSMKYQRKDFSKRSDCQNLDASSAGPSQAAIIDHNVNISADTEHGNELNLKLWKARAHHIQQILSMPHEEHCPLYSYSGCKKLGIDFNVGSGVKKNLDPKLLTNGIMVELHTFATALESSTKYIATEILEYNFHLNLKNDLYRSAFALQILAKIQYYVCKSYNISHKDLLFDLPDLKSIQAPIYDHTRYCPKCYQDRNNKLHHDQSDPSHMPHPSTMTGTVSADANCSVLQPAEGELSTAPATEETIMNSYPCCKEVGLNLCVDKDRPKDKLDTYVLTRGVMKEVANFAKTLCGTKHKIINDVLEHNFNIGPQMQDVDPAQLFCQAKAEKSGGLEWFSEVFVIEPPPLRQLARGSKARKAHDIQRSERKETITKRQLALQTKKDRAVLERSDSVTVVKSRKTVQCKGICYPICTEIGLDLDVTSKSGEKEKLDLKLLTRAVVAEIHKFATHKTGHYFPGTLFDILDYNFDLSSQHDRRWEFSIATASAVNNMVKNYRKKRIDPDKVFKLPFLVASKRSEGKRKIKKREKRSKKNESESDDSRVDFLDDVNSNEELWFHHEGTESPTHPGNWSPWSQGRGSPLQGKVEMKEEEYSLHYGGRKTETNTGGYVLVPVLPNPVQYYILTQPPAPEACAMPPVCPDTESIIKNDSDTELEAPGSPGYTMVTIGDVDDSTLIKEEQDSDHYGVVSYTGDDVGINLE